MAGMFGGGGGSAAPQVVQAPAPPVLAPAPPMPVPDPAEQRAAAERAQAKENARYTTRDSTIIGSSDTLG